MHLSKGADAHAALADDLEDGLGVAAEIHCRAGGADPIDAPPIVARVGQSPFAHFVPEPIQPEATAELRDEHVLHFAEENGGVLQNVTGVGAADAGDAPKHFGADADAPRDVARQVIEERLHRRAGVRVAEGLDLFAGLQVHNARAGVEDALRGDLGGRLAHAGTADRGQARTEVGGGGLAAGGDEADLAEKFVAVLHVLQHLGHVLELVDGVGHPRDAARLTVAADLAEVQHVGRGDVSAHALVGGEHTVGNRAAEAIQAHAVDPFGLVVVHGHGRGVADVLSADKAHHPLPCGGLHKLTEEVAVGDDLAKDQGLGLVEVNLARAVEGAGLVAHRVLEAALGGAVELGVGRAALRDDAGADAVAGDAVDGAQGESLVVGQPARLLHQGLALERGQLEGGVERRKVNVAAGGVRLGALIGGKVGERRGIFG